MGIWQVQAEPGLTGDRVHTEAVYKPSHAMLIHETSAHMLPQPNCVALSHAIYVCYVYALLEALSQLALLDDVNIGFAGWPIHDCV